MQRVKATVRIASLGSSYAAGPGIAPQTTPSAARRSQKNYPHLLAASLSASLTDLTVSGATLDNVLTTPQTVSGTTFPPQLSQLPHDSDVVTITGGGNDLSYVGGLMHECLSTSFSGRLLARILPLSPPSEHSPKDASDKIARKLIALVDGVHLRAPRAKIYLVEYLTLFGSHNHKWKDVALPQSRLEYYQDMANALRSAYKQAGEARSGLCEVVGMADLSWEHGLGAEEPWVGGFGLMSLARGHVILHPNEAGMQAVARVLEKRISSADAVDADS
ncbi:hypothetical protein E4T44_00562 [Aureobasidium sp. EXF-8845]|nr:hypothetical protein E4T44_00562 [Aureobasidium sp. EXF-8845]KAI4857968.1 hypothetical protein E4T45_00526 [Aureobasidium sp. EXF-8846]